MNKGLKFEKKNYPNYYKVYHDSMALDDIRLELLTVSNEFTIYEYNTAYIVARLVFKKEVVI